MATRRQNIWPATQRVLDAAPLERAIRRRTAGSNGFKVFRPATQACELYGTYQIYLPQEHPTGDIEALRRGHQGPLTTPIGGASARQTLALRQIFDLYCLMLPPLPLLRQAPQPAQTGPRHLDVICVYRETRRTSTWGSSGPPNCIRSASN